MTGSAGMDEGTYVAECFWPGVSERDLSALDERTQARVAELSQGGKNVRYRCSFVPTRSSSAASRAAIPFERILETAESPWPLQ
jgi:hypothetical protein